MFRHAASRCAQAVSNLQAKIRGLGGGPEKRGSVSGSLHRAWVDLLRLCLNGNRIAGVGLFLFDGDCETGQLLPSLRLSRSPL